MKKTVIVMPVANEEETMEEIIAEILALPCNELYLYPVIDRFSKDRTEEIIRSHEKRTDKVKCIYYGESRGVVSCYLEGFRRAIEDGADWVIEMDGGGSHLPSEIPQFLEYLEKGYECVWGSRFTEGGSIKNQPLYRKILSKSGTFLANLVLGTGLKDMTSGFEGFQREVLLRMNLEAFLSSGHMYQTEMRYYCRNKKAAEVPIHYTGGKSSLRFSAVKEAVFVLFGLKRNEKYVMKSFGEKAL